MRHESTMVSIKASQVWRLPRGPDVAEHFQVFMHLETELATGMFPA